MSLRMTPEIRFLKDEFIQRGEQVICSALTMLLIWFVWEKLALASESA